MSTAGPIDPSFPPSPPLYDPAFEHDACGTGFVADRYGRPSHAILARALEAVVNLTHRGAVDAEGKTGDGAGLLTQLPRALFVRYLAEHGIVVADPARLAAGMVFLPGDNEAATARCRAIIDDAIAAHGLQCLAWRPVPVDPDVLGQKALLSRPTIEQVLVLPPAGLEGDEYERTLYLVRKASERQLRAEEITDCYLPSFSHRTIVYKGLFVAPQLGAFYADLRDPEYTTGLAVFHQRYSTNTLPNWFMAQPFRMLAHNGEINTIQGNRNWMRARESELRSSVWGERASQLAPVIVPGGSDSAELDNALELLQRSGRNILHSMLMLVPEAWENLRGMDPLRRAFYQYHACLIEPWDGPASLTFSDGQIVGQMLDRNGLRPARYTVYDDGLIVAGSEVGIVDVDEARVVEKGRLGPGEVLAVDTANGTIYHNDAAKQMIAAAQPYGDWLTQHFRTVLTTTELNGHLPIDDLSLLQRQQIFGYSNEEIRIILEEMVKESKDAVWSMGDDAPLAVLSHKPRLLQGYFRQRFAQVTNPPIDSLREELVMSIDAYLGRRGSLLEATPEHAHLLHITSPLLTGVEFTTLLNQTDPAFRSQRFDATLAVAAGPAGLEATLNVLCAQAEAAVRDGVVILVLSDRAVSAERAPVPMLLAVSAVHHHLIRVGLRLRADLICETGDAWDVHHFALLAGYGASAVYPYLAWEGIGSLAGSRGFEELTVEIAQTRFRKSIEDGLRKIMSKMGISCLSSYRGAQIFEAIGLDARLVERYFTETPSRIGGATLEDLAAEVLRRHGPAFSESLGKRLVDLGLYRYRRDGEAHAYNPQTVPALQAAAISGDYRDWEAFTRLVYERPPAAIRDLLELRPLGGPIPLDEVESVESIRRRFTSQAMSLGALSPEAHAAIATGMNRIGGRSNTGEGGEDPAWWAVDENGDSANSAVKQVASARFGVTPEYLSRATELEIKMAQGSKPGEGGQIPAAKVSPLIARLRHTIPGIPLISPPPHHDIYSIEDLAQLIYDLKIANPRARIGVKLVAETGVGTIAAGVAKGYADYILISGHSGGTGASPLSSIKNAGCPWELGLAETQQVLVMNGLRDKVTLRTDGGLMTGRDVIVAAMLGAEEYGFGTATLVALGCDMARQCHLNTCPTGIATQRADLRAKFRGKPEMVVNLFTLLAMEVRQWLAGLGARSLTEIIGRADCLTPRQLPKEHPSARLDLTAIITPADLTGTQPRLHLQERNDRPNDEPLDDQIISDAAAALDGLGSVTLAYKIRNSNRTVGARLAGEVARRYGNRGLPDQAIRITFQGTAGQSFGAFLTPGIHLLLTGQANDYVAKGLGGGEIVVRPDPAARFVPHQNVIVGNTVLYGATGGHLFVAGRAGERFAVRNSGARAVVEGCGDHGCEYMTEGLVAILGPTGRNFAAGMSAGIAYVLDEDDQFETRCNQDMVSLQRLTSLDDEAELRALITRHAEQTGSARALAILAGWDDYRPRFWKVVPRPVRVQTTAPEDSDLLRQPSGDAVAKRA